LTQKNNKKAANKSFEEKIEIYKKENSIKTNKKIIELFEKHKSFNLDLVKDYQDFLWAEVERIFQLKN